MTQITVALAQIAPDWLQRAGTIDRVVEQIEQASSQGARLITFGEAFIPGYPFWQEYTDGARFESDFQKTMYAHYAEQAVQIERGDLQPICHAARAHKLWAVIGIIERPLARGGHSLYCSAVTIDDQGVIRNVHRKLVPTYEERLVWSPGDGHGLRTFAIDGFILGALNCWENWMPLARSAMYAQGVDLHVALWPGSVRNTQDITRFIAREGRSYVVSVGGLMRRSNIGDGVPHADILREAMPEVSANGGACIAGPDGEWIISPHADQAGLLVATLDAEKIRRERQNFDPFGHYSRPDVLKLHIDAERQQGYVIE